MVNRYNVSIISTYIHQKVILMHFSSHFSRNISFLKRKVLDSDVDLDQHGYFHHYFPVDHVIPSFRPDLSQQTAWLFYFPFSSCTRWTMGGDVEDTSKPPVSNVPVGINSVQHCLSFPFSVQKIPHLWWTGRRNLLRALRKWFTGCLRLRRKCIFTRLEISQDCRIYVVLPGQPRSSHIESL